MFYKSFQNHLKPTQYKVKYMCELILILSGSFLSYLFFLFQGKNCSHPIIPEHGGFRCEPSPCRGFPQKSIIHFFCEPGYVLPNRRTRSKCQHGEWHPKVPVCIPRPGKRNLKKSFFFTQQLQSSHLPSFEVIDWKQHTQTFDLASFM